MRIECRASAVPNVLILADSESGQNVALNTASCVINGNLDHELLAARMNNALKALRRRAVGHA